MAAKLKALQQWCKIRSEGYRDVEVTNMTSSWKSGLAFGAIIHRYRPDLINYDVLKKEDVYENCKLAFDVALDHLGIPALLDAEDMVTMTVPDKLCIITYVAQYYNYFHDKPILGGPGVQGTQTKAVKRPSIQTSIHTSHSEEAGSGPEAKNKKISAGSNSTATINDGASSKRSTMDDKCYICHQKVYLLERSYASGKLCHRFCQRNAEKSQRQGDNQSNKENIASGRTVLYKNDVVNDSKTGHNGILNTTSELNVPKTTSSSSNLLKSLYTTPPAYQSQSESSVSMKTSVVTDPVRISNATPITSHSALVTKSYQSSITTITSSRNVEPYKSTVNTQPESNSRVAPSAQPSCVELPSNRFISKSSGFSADTSVSNSSAGVISSGKQNGGDNKGITEFNNNDMKDKHKSEAIGSSGIKTVTTTVNTCRSTTSVITTPNSNKSNGAPLTFGLVFTVATTTKNSNVTISSVSTTASSSHTTTTSVISSISTTKPSAQTSQTNSVSSERRPFIIRPPTQNNKEKSVTNIDKVVMPVTDSDKAVMPGLLQYLNKACDRKLAGDTSDKTSQDMPQKPPRSFENNPGLDSKPDPIPSSNKDYLSNKRSNSPCQSYSGNVQPNSVPEIPKARPRTTQLDKSSDPQSKPSWQLEAEKRIQARNGKYVDPEKVPRSIDTGAKTPGQVNPPARPPPPRAVAPSVNKNTNDSETKNVASPRNVVEIHIPEPARRIVVSPENPSNKSNGFKPVTTVSSVVFNVSVNTTDSGASGGNRYTSPQAGAVSPPSGALSSHTKGMAPQPPVAAPRAPHLAVEPSRYPADDSYIESPEISRSRDCLHDNTAESGGRRKILPAQKFSFEDEIENDRKSQIVPGQVFTVSPNDSQLPDFQDTTEEVKSWLDTNRLKIEGGYNVPMRQVNAEKRMAVTLINTRLEQLDEKLQVVELEGRELEEQIRSRNDEAMDDDQDDLMIKWFQLVKRRYEFIRDETELLYKRRAQELEDIHGEVEHQLRRLMQKPDYLRTNDDKVIEEALLEMLVKTVSDRNSIVDSMETDRLRYLEEDKNIDDMLQASGLSTPVNKYNNDVKKNKKKSKEEGDGKPKKSILRALSLRKKSVPTMETSNSFVML